MSNCVVFIISLVLTSTTVFDDIDSYSTERIPFDLRYCSFDEIIHYVNDELDVVILNNNLNSFHFYIFYKIKNNFMFDQKLTK
jgi:hypothetical protein